MLSNSQVKHIHSLKLKKFREIHRQFIAEGSKLVTDLMRSFYHIDSIFATKEWIRENPQLIISGKLSITEVTPAEMARITSLTTASPVLAVVDIPMSDLAFPDLSSGLTLLIDDISDPGNLGTILRIADWFGISRVICSEDTVDLYNPKTIQATMGSVARVKVTYTDLAGLLQQAAPGVKIYGTFLQGENIYEKDLEQTGVIIIGNESKGISGQVAQFVTDRLFIPGFHAPGDPAGRAESLNASVAAAIVCSEFRRRSF
jgi:RNA methyltransferase, TrmH family